MEKYYAGLFFLGLYILFVFLLQVRWGWIAIFGIMGFLVWFMMKIVDDVVEAMKKKG